MEENVLIWVLWTTASTVTPLISGTGFLLAKIRKLANIYVRIDENKKGNPARQNVLTQISLIFRHKTPWQTAIRFAHLGQALKLEVLKCHVNVFPYQECLFEACTYPEDDNVFFAPQNVALCLRWFKITTSWRALTV